MKIRPMVALSLTTLMALLLPLLCPPRLVQGEPVPPIVHSTEQASAVSFAKRSIDGGFFGFSDVWAADVDGEDGLDIIASGRENDGDPYEKIAWHENNGSGSFTGSAY